MKHREPRYPNKLLVIGTVTAVVGVVLLLATLGPLTLPAGPLARCPCSLAGLVFLYLAYVRGRARPGTSSRACSSPSAACSSSSWRR